jgi:hypothetical protein
MQVAKDLLALPALKEKTAEMGAQVSRVLLDLRVVRGLKVLRE